MRKLATLVGLAGLTAATVALLVASAGAANDPTFRDCSFVGGLDPDFVKLSGATPGSGGSLSVSPSQNQVQVEASESSDPGDSSGHDTFKLTITAPGAPTRTVSGAGTGKVILTAPLSGAAAGSSYTIDWAATFDNGNHQCPSSQTPQNTTANPFVVTVAPATGTNGGSTAPTPNAPTNSTGAPAPKKHSRSCRTRTKRVHGHTRKVRVCKKTKKSKPKHHGTTTPH